MWESAHQPINREQHNVKISASTDQIANMDLPKDCIELRDTERTALETTVAVNLTLEVLEILRGDTSSRETTIPAECVSAVFDAHVEIH